MTATSGYLLHVACTDCVLYLSFAGESLQLDLRIQKITRKIIFKHFTVAKRTVKETFTECVVNGFVLNILNDLLLTHFNMYMCTNVTFVVFDKQTHEAKFPPSWLKIKTFKYIVCIVYF